MPKHLLLGLTLRHLIGSAEVVTLINRFGHYASYSILLELETAMCRSVTERGSMLPSTVQPDGNVVTHLCWDNFDMKEETPSGTTHTAHSIIIQELSADTQKTPILPASHHKTKERSIACQPRDLEPCFVKDKAEPALTTTSTEYSNPELLTQTINSDILWICSRGISTNDPQKSTTMGRLGVCVRKHQWRE